MIQLNRVATHLGLLGAVSFSLVGCNRWSPSSLVHFSLAPLIPSATAPVVPNSASQAPASLRTYVSLQYVSLGTTTVRGSAAEVSLTVTLPEGAAREIPKLGDSWRLASGEKVPIFQTYEVPAEWIQNDKFGFTIQMHRKGEKYQACKFSVENVSKFNRIYVCRSVEGETRAQAADASALAVQVSVLTNRNLSPTQMARRLARR